MSPSDISKYVFWVLSKSEKFLARHPRILVETPDMVLIIIFLTGVCLSETKFWRTFRIKTETRISYSYLYIHVGWVSLSTFGLLRRIFECYCVAWTSQSSFSVILSYPWILTISCWGYVKCIAAYNGDDLWLTICARYPCEKELNTGLSRLSVRCWTGQEEGRG